MGQDLDGPVGVERAHVSLHRHGAAVDRGVVVSAGLAVGGHVLESMAGSVTREGIGGTSAYRWFAPGRETGKL